MTPSAPFGQNVIEFIANDILAATVGIAANVIGLSRGILQIGQGIISDKPGILSDGLREFGQSLMPRYGNLGGAAYGVGPQPNLPSLLGSSPINPLDGTFDIHDNQSIAGGPVSQQQADKNLLGNMWRIPQPGPFGQLYRMGATIGFGAAVLLRGDE